MPTDRPFRSDAEPTPESRRRAEEYGFRGLDADFVGTIIDDAEARARMHPSFPVLPIDEELDRRIDRWLARKYGARAPARKLRKEAIPTERNTKIGDALAVRSRQRGYSATDLRDDIAQALDAAEARVREEYEPLAKALRRYADHLEWCHVVPCTCGLEELLREREEVK